MLLGLISDTHDNLSSIRKAVGIFNERKVNLTLHAGDYVSPFTAEAFKNLRCKLIGVYGNVDGDREVLKERYSKIGADVEGFLKTLELEGLKLVLIHGSPPELIDALAKCGDYDVVVHGHLHKAYDVRKRSTLVASPGEACGYLTGRGTVALLELPTLKLEYIDLGTT